MFAVRSRNFNISLVLAAALAFSMWPAASRAYTDEQQQACSADAFRLCGADIPDVDRITACMVRNKSQLTPGCRAFFREPESTVTAVAAGKPLSIRPANARKGVSAKPRTVKKPANPGATGSRHEFVLLRCRGLDCASSFPDVQLHI